MSDSEEGPRDLFSWRKKRGVSLAQITHNLNSCHVQLTVLIFIIIGVTI